MSMTRNAARRYVAGVISGRNDPNLYDAAEEAILESFSDWQTAKFWQGLYKNTTLGFSVANCSGNSATLTAPSSGVFDGVNPSMTITVSGNGATLPAGTTVSSYTRNTDGTIATITLSNSVTSATDVYTATFGGNIPIIAGTQDYNVPPDFNSPAIGRLLTRGAEPLVYIKPKQWHLKIADPTAEGAVEAYTIFNVVSPVTQNKGTKRLRLYRIPSANDTLVLDYYRSFVILADPLDIDDDYLYKFLAYARAKLLATKRGQDDPGSYIKLAGAGLQNAMVDDEEESADEEVRLISQMEQGSSNRALWSNGQFSPFYGE